MFKDRIKRICLETIEKKRWRPFNDISVDVMSESQIPLFFYLTLADRKISINVCDDFEKQIDKFIKSEKIDMSPNEILDNILYFAVLHEHGHHKYCPKTKEGFQSIIDGAYNALNERDYIWSRILSFVGNMHNLFSDTVLNTVISNTDEEKHKYRKGYILSLLFSSYYMRQPVIQERGILGKLSGRHDKGMALFLSSNLILCKIPFDFVGKMKKNMPIFFRDHAWIIEKIITVFSGNFEKTKDIIKHQKINSQFLGRIQDRMLWKDMTYEYTRIIFPYMKKEYEQTKSSFVKNLKNAKSYAEKQKEAKNKSQQESHKSDMGEKDAENKKQSGPDVDKDVIEEYINRMESELNHIPYSSPLLNQFYWLDEIYRNRAGRFILHGEDKSNPNPKYEYRYNRDSMPIGEFDSKSIEWSSTKILSRGNTRHVELFKKDLSLELPFEGSENNPGIPDIAFIFDSSISMKFNPEKGTGEYHYAVLAFYSILKDLEQRNLAHLLNYNMINFSNKTICSGWKNYNQINDVKKVLFDYQKFNTILDPKALVDLRTQRMSNFIALLFSDTQFNTIENNLQCLEQIKLMRDSGAIGFFLFQLGQHSLFSLKLIKENIPVHQINDAEDFLNKSVEFTKNLYGTVLQS